MERNSKFIFDKNINSFSPEGRLYQLEYTIKASDNSGAVCIITKGLDSICLVEEKKRNLFDSKSSKDSFSLKLDDFSGCVCSGISGDLNSTISEIIQEFIYFHEKNGYNISIDQLANNISKKKTNFNTTIFHKTFRCKNCFFWNR